jgi:hypothetical protein
MNFDIHLLILILGILLTCFWGTVVFSDRFFDLMNRAWWKVTERDEESMSKQAMNNFNRYGRGLGGFLGGIILLIFSLWYYLGH